MSASPRWRSLHPTKRRIPLVLLLFGALVAGLYAPSANAHAASWTTVVSDSFSRELPSGWGRPPTGGDYVLTVPSRAKASVLNRNGTFESMTAGSRAVAMVPVNLGDVRVRSSVKPEGPSNLDLLHTWRVRQSANGSQYYAITYRNNPAGSPILSVSRVVNGVSTWIQGVNVPARAVSGSTLWLEAEVIGTSPVTMRIRAWLGGTPMPDWQLNVSDASGARVQAAGQVGLDDYIRTAASPVTLRHDDVLVERPADGAAPAPAPQEPVASAPGQPAPAQPPAPAPAPEQPQPPAAPQLPAAAPRGATLGSTSYRIPSNAIFVSPSGSDTAAGTQASPLRTVRAAIAKAPAGGTIVMRAGTYHESVTIPHGKTLTLQSYPREVVWFDGSVPVTNWTRSGTAWVATGWTKRFSSSMGTSHKSMFIDPKYPLAANPDQLFINGVAQKQVGSLAAVTAGTFYVDYATSRLYLGSDPSGREVRASALEQAIKVLAVNSTLQGFGVRRYATPYEVRGTVQADPVGGTFRQLVIEDNATIGIALHGADKVIDQVTVRRNGMLGIGANRADRMAVTNSIISNNNAENFNYIPVSGGIKITTTNTVRIHNNEVRSNGNGLGIWLDEFCRNFTIINNISTDNGHEQIEVEISTTGVIANNVATGGRTGIRVYNTDNVKVFNNHVGGQTHFGIELSQDKRWQTMPRPGFTLLVKNITVSNNVFGCSRWFQFYARDGETGIPVDAMAVSITGNQFVSRANSAGPTMVAWAKNDNVTLERYETPQSLADAKNKSWRNAQAGSCVTLQDLGATVSANQAIAVPLPSDVATALGVPAGTVRLGLFS